MKNMPEPKNPQEVCRLLGMCNYLSSIIPTLSLSSEPLRHLIEKGTGFRWTEVERKSFNELKQLISSDQLLIFHDVHKSVVIQCDASRENLGAIVLQEGPSVVSALRSLMKS